MVEVQFIRNNNQYPFYSSNAGTVVNTVMAKPVSKNLRSGFVDVELTNISNFNYIRYTLHGKQIYAWVTDVEHIAGNKLYRVHFTTDAYRTYINNVVIGTQFIERSPEPTNLHDPLLGSTEPTNIFFTQNYSFPNPDKRYLIVQVREHPADFISMTPGQPSMYNFYVAEYDVNNWRASSAIVGLMEEISYGEKPNNIVTLYSVPHIDLSGDGFLSLGLQIKYANSDSVDVAGWKVLRDKAGNQNRFVASCPIDLEGEGFLKTSHNISIVIPDAGIINVPDAIAVKDYLNVKMYVDIFTGACNYILCIGDNPTHLSVRGGATNSIPIISDPFDNYISQNQNSLMASILGDVANLGYGLYTGNPVPISAGGTGLLNKVVTLADAKNEIPSTPPAFLGSALMPHFNKRFWVQYNYAYVDNDVKVNERYGYPKNMVDEVTIPNQGFLKLQNCSVCGTGNTSVPQWAIEEINSRFNEGIFYV
jgi:hypothetical protein